MKNLNEIIFIFGLTAILFFVFADVRFEFVNKPLSVNYLVAVFLFEIYFYSAYKILKKLKS